MIERIAKPFVAYELDGSNTTLEIETASYSLKRLSLADAMWCETVPQRRLTEPSSEPWQLLVAHMWEAVRCVRSMKGYLLYANVEGRKRWTRLLNFPQRHRSSRWQTR